jgi:tetratricopeptide (TPR) repeat protein
MEQNNPVVQKIADAMVAQGMLAKHVADKANIDPAQFSRILRGREFPGMKAAERLEEALGFDKGELTSLIVAAKLDMQRAEQGTLKETGSVLDTPLVKDNQLHPASMALGPAHKAAEALREFTQADDLEEAEEQIRRVEEAMQEARRRIAFQRTADTMVWELVQTDSPYPTKPTEMEFSMETTTTLSTTANDVDFFQRGFAHGRNKDYAAAAADFREVLRLNPTDIRGQLALGATLHLQKRYTEAIALLEKPHLQNHWMAQALRGHVRLAEGKFGEAIVAFTTARIIAQSNGFDVPALKNMLAFAERKQQEALPREKRNLNKLVKFG